jgi:hypothetical protein
MICSLQRFLESGLELGLPYHVPKKITEAEVGEEEFQLELGHQSRDSGEEKSVKARELVRVFYRRIEGGEIESDEHGTNAMLPTKQFNVSISWFAISPGQIRVSVRAI